MKARKPSKLLPLGPHPSCRQIAQQEIFRLGFCLLLSLAAFLFCIYGLILQQSTAFFSLANTVHLFLSQKGATNAANES